MEEDSLAGIYYDESLVRCQNWKAESSLLYKYRCVSVQIKSVWLLIFWWISELLNWTGGGGRCVSPCGGELWRWRLIRSEAESDISSVLSSPLMWQGSGDAGRGAGNGTFRTRESNLHRNSDHSNQLQSRQFDNAPYSFSSQCTVEQRLY